MERILPKEYTCWGGKELPGSSNESYWIC